MSGIIGLDTNIFIYHFQQNKDFGESAKKVFEKIISGKKKAVTSVITLTELLAIKGSYEDVNTLHNAFLQLPNLTTYDVTQEIGVEAAKIRRLYGFRIPDAIQLATALHGEAEIFITNDAQLLNFKEIKMTLLDDFRKI